MSAAGAFLGIALVTLIGFFGGLLARRGHFPDLLMLIALGVLVGPMNDEFFRWAALSSALHAFPLDAITPIFGALALAVIMFDAGLNLHLTDMATGLRRALAHTLSVFVLTVAAVAAVSHLVLGFPILIGILFGAILGGISSAVVVSVAQTLPVRPETKTMLTLECVIVDVLSIATAVAVIEAIRGGALDGTGALRGVASNLAVALVGGLAVGLAFTFSLPKLRGVGNLYVLSLGALFGTYGLVEVLGGSGPMAVLAFGLVLGNSRNPLFGGRDLAPELSDEINHFHRQVSFLVRTFFFVLLGLTFSLAVFGHTQVLATSLPGLSAWNGTWPLLAVGIVALYAAILLPRLVVVATSRTLEEDRLAATLVLGRGLGSAVLATFPFTIPAFADPTTAYHRALEPYRDVIPTLTSLLVILTVVTTAVGAAVAARARAKRTGSVPLDVGGRTGAEPVDPARR